MKKVIQSRSFEKRVKKLTKTQKASLDDVIREIIKEPEIGKQKKGDLKGIYVYKFKLNNSVYLLAYRFTESLIELIMIGPHENYYRDLKSYIKR